MSIIKSKLALLGGESIVGKKNTFPKDRPSLDEEAVKGVVSVLRSGAWSMFTSNEVNEFESQFADYVGGKGAVLVNSCTNAIYSCLLATKPKINSKVVVPAFTYIGTCLPVKAANCEAVFCDTNESGDSLSFEKFKNIVTSQDIHAVIHPHLFGRIDIENTKKIVQLCKANKIHYIADCAQFIGIKEITAYLSNVGMCCFSFGESKILRIGEGGAIVSNSDVLIEELRKVRHEGEEWVNGKTSRTGGWQPSPNDVLDGLESTSIGLNFRPNAVMARLGKHQLLAIDKILDKTEANANYLLANLKKFTFIKLPRADDRKWWTLPITIRHSYFSRSEILAMLISEGIPAGVHFPKLIYEHAIFKDDIKIDTTDFPNALFFSQNHIVLPIYPLLDESHMVSIVKVFEKIENTKEEKDINRIKKICKITLVESEIEELCSGLFLFLNNLS